MAASRATSRAEAKSSFKPPPGLHFDPREPPPHVAYQESLDALAKVDDRYRPVAALFRDFDPYNIVPSVEKMTEKQTMAGSVFLYDLTARGLKMSLCEHTTSTGHPLGMSSIELASKILDFPRPPDSKIRLLVHSYRSVREAVGWNATTPLPSDLMFERVSYCIPEGLNFHLLAMVAQKLGVRPDAFLPHFGRQTEVVEGLPSQRKVLLLSSHRFLCTAQIADDGEYSQDYKTVVLFTREYRVGLGQNILWCTMDYLQRDLGDTLSLLSLDERSRDFHQAYVNASLSMLRHMTPTQVAAAEQNPAELLVPFLRLTAMSILRSLSDWDALLDTYGHDRELGPAYSYVAGKLRSLREMHEGVKTVFGHHWDGSNNEVLRDFEFVVVQFETKARSLREQLNYEASMASLKESRLQIQQNESIKRLTQLAFIFIPLSFITSVFGMNVDLLSGQGAKWWTVIIGTSIVYIIVAVPFAILQYNPMKARLKERWKRHDRKSDNN